MRCCESGTTAEDDLRRSRESGFDHHLVKPVDLDVLRELQSGVPEGPTGADRAEADLP